MGPETRIQRPSELDARTGTWMMCDVIGKAHAILPGIVKAMRTDMCVVAVYLDSGPASLRYL